MSNVQAAALQQVDPPRANAVSASLTFAWRAILKLKHVPEQLGDVIGIPVLFTLMFTYLFGGALAGHGVVGRGGAIGVMGAVTLSAAPNANDKFQLQPTRRGATSIATVLDQSDQLAFAAPVNAQATLLSALCWCW